jgi:hypothetical protein
MGKKGGKNKGKQVIVSSGADLGAFSSSAQKLKEQQEADFFDCGHERFKPAESF